jgi:glycosyltransferase involved in cell wall biosynthesis
VSRASVVIPTYNRGEALGTVLDLLLASDLKGVGEIEVVVVDDGSPTEAAPIVNARQAPAGFNLRCVRQENAGPAAARNLGFASTRGDVVIFIDDDILVPPELVRDHVEAHVLNPGSVIFGVCVPPPGAHGHVANVLASLYANRPDRPRFERVSVIASGQLSVERRFFSDGVYASQLRTPAAEEFELSARLQNRGIVALNATRITAIHDQGFEISDVCDQQYKHGVGCAEAVSRLSSTLIMDELARIAEANGLVRSQDPLPKKCKKVAKGLAAILWVRRSLVLLSKLIGRIVPSQRINLELLSFVIGVFFFAGYRDGLRRFARSVHDANLTASARRYS